MKWFACILCLLAFIASSRAGQVDESEFLRQLKEKPAQSPEAAGWFASLPMEKKRAFADKIGQIVLDSPDSSTFAVAFGANQSPYPWVLIVGGSTDRMKLLGGNYFKYEFRDDERVKKQWQVCWYNDESYRASSSNGRIVFAKRQDEKKDPNNLFGVWISQFGWRYVGPKLPKFGPKTEEERNAIAEIEKLGGDVHVDIRVPEYRATEVSLPAGVANDAMKRLRYLSDLRGLTVGYADITDAGLENLKGLTNLRDLCLVGVKISDASLKHLKGLTQLRDLRLNDNKIADAGLLNLKGLTQLEILYLNHTNVTDAGLEHLKGLTQLRELDLRYTEVSDQGVAKLQKALPKCKVRWRPGD
ncbi:MAG: hypothetical protein NTW96_24960 [Planctomycetia bacterium]|nr:hypothetical protein [Planctomycetia bacterium]